MSGELCNSFNMRLALAELRRKRNITQEKLADLSGLHRSTIARIEIQNIGWTHQTLETLADALDCQIWELFGYSHPPDNDLSEHHRGLMQRVAQVNERGAKLLLAQCDKMIEEGMIREAMPSANVRRHGRPRKKKDRAD